MKKLFTVFCAICLMPTFSAQAWIGGPFSNNSFFGERGDDGVYEAAATAVNGIGLFRIVVGNDFAGVNPQGVIASVPSEEAVPGLFGAVVDVPGIASGNVVIGAYGSTTSNIWYHEGITYRGVTTGTASSTMGIVQGYAEAYSTRVVEPVTIPAVAPVVVGTTIVIPGIPGVIQDLTPVASLSSAFTAYFQASGDLLPSRTFVGTGQGVMSDANGAQGIPFNFSVFGSKVSSKITLGL